MNYLFRLFLPIYFLGISLTSHCQSWNWAKQATGTGTSSYNIPYDIVTDTNRNSYVVGEFNCPVTFGSVSISAPVRNIFVAKFDSLGTCIWAKRAGTFNVSSALSIAIDQHQDLVISGLFYGAASFDSFTINSNGQSDIFIAKISSAGVWQWVKSYGSPSYDSGNQVATDINNNIYLAGTSAGTLIFDTCTVSGLGNYDAFIAKFSPTGLCQWVRYSLSSDKEKATCVTVSPMGTIYVGGVYSGDPNIFGDTLNSIGQIDEYDYISKLDTAGNTLWTKQLSCGAMNSMYGINSIAADNQDNVYFTGYFSYSCVLDAYFFNLSPSSAIRNSYVAKLDAASNVVWAKQGAGRVNNWASAVSVGPDNYCYLTGYYTDTIAFDDCASYNPGGNGYTMRLDSLGNCLCINNFKNTFPTSIFADAASVFVAGYFSGTALFGGYTLTTSRPIEILIANSTICPEPLTTDISGSGRKEDIVVYPNPASEHIKVDVEKEETIQIYNLMGTLLLESEVKGATEFNISALAEGMYLIRLKNTPGFCQKFIKN